MPFIPLESIPPGRIEDSNPGLLVFRSGATAAGAAKPFLGFGKNPGNRILGRIIGVYACVSMLAGFIAHRVGGFSAPVTLAYSTTNVFSGIGVILLGIFVINRHIQMDEGVSLRGWIMAIGSMATLHLVIQLVGYTYIRNKPELFARGGGTYAVVTFFVRGAAILVAVLVYEAVLRRRRFRQKHEESLQLALAYRDSEISRLRAQLSPHFLFNALGGIAAESERPRVVESMVSGLADVLRYNLSQTEAKASFSKEVDVVKSYLLLERVRFGEGLSFAIDIPSDAQACRVPQPLLLPLIENAIKYGRETSGTRLDIRVGASLVEDRLRLWVENSGKWVQPAPAQAGRQVGLANLIRRLELHLGKADYLKVESLPESVRVSVELPVEFS